ncbi:MAG TPA: asparagine synthase-related protein, partial [Stellaceae bacterium]|nr:asparagine synthase-related protein [Stellaceae bacterium]
FLGYPRYQAMRHLARLDRLPSWGRLALARLLAYAPTRLQQELKLSRIRDVLEASAGQAEQRYGGTIVFFGDRDKEAGYGEAMRERLGQSSLDLLAPYFAATDGLVTGANWADLHTYLPDDLLVKVDVASMAHGLETRSPLLDHVLLEWAAGIPAEVKMARGQTKALFKRAMEPYLPREVIYRKKMGFGCPIDEWLRAELKPLAYDTLLSRSARERGLLRPDYVRRLLDEHCSGRQNHHYRLWALLMLELWFEMWIDGAAEQAVLRPAA